MTCNYSWKFVYSVFCGVLFFELSRSNKHLTLLLSTSLTHNTDFWLLCTTSMYYLFCKKYLKKQDTAKDTIHKISAIINIIHNCSLNCQLEKNFVRRGFCRRGYFDTLPAFLHWNVWIAAINGKSHFTVECHDACLGRELQKKAFLEWQMSYLSWDILHIEYQPN